MAVPADAWEPPDRRRSARRTTGNSHENRCSQSARSGRWHGLGGGGAGARDARRRGPPGRWRDGLGGSGRDARGAQSRRGLHRGRSRRSSRRARSDWARHRACAPRREGDDAPGRAPAVRRASFDSGRGCRTGEPGRAGGAVAQAAARGRRRRADPGHAARPDPASVAYRARPSRGRPGAARPRRPGALRAACEPPRHLAVQVGDRGPRVPGVGFGGLQGHRRTAQRKARRPRTIRRGRRAPGRCGAPGPGNRRGGDRARKAHPQHLAQDAAQVAQRGAGRHRAVVRSARHPSARRYRGRVLYGPRRGARAVDAHSPRVRRLHHQPQAERLPLSAHRGDGTGRQDPGGADPDARDAPAGGVGRGRPLAVQGGRAVRGARARRTHRLAATAPRGRARRRSRRRLRSPRSAGSSTRSGSTPSLLAGTSSISRPARPPSTSPTRFIPRSVIGVGARRSTGGSCR